jgi:hypothetical protein
MNDKLIELRTAEKALAVLRQDDAGNVHLDRCDGVSDEEIETHGGGGLMPCDSKGAPATVRLGVGVVRVYDAQGVALFRLKINEDGRLDLGHPTLKILPSLPLESVTGNGNWNGLLSLSLMLK